MARKPEAGASKKPSTKPTRAAKGPVQADPSPPASPSRRKVLVVDDHPIVRERLSELINQEQDFLVCGEAEDSLTALKAIEAHQPDIAIVDITLKDTYGIELIKQIKDRWPKLPVLVLSMHDESLYGERALRAGAKGYLNKQQATTQIIGAIRKVLGGEIFVSDKMAATILQKVAGGKSAEGASPTDILTDRELEVFQLLGQGLGVRQIAENLFVSVKTVEAHREHIKQKMNFKSSAELLRYAFAFTMKDT
jgi:DNA-binding NarL/FixJ family response regulator